jgi:hypothetical protein
VRNKKVKQMICDGYAKKYLSTNYSQDKSRSDWAFDRLRLFESGVRRSKLRNPHLSKVSIEGDQQ